MLRKLRRIHAELLLAMCWPSIRFSLCVEFALARITGEPFDAEAFIVHCLPCTRVLFENQVKTGGENHEG